MPNFQKVSYQTTAVKYHSNWVAFIEVTGNTLVTVWPQCHRFTSSSLLAGSEKVLSTVFFNKMIKV